MNVSLLEEAIKAVIKCKKGQDFELKDEGNLNNFRVAIKFSREIIEKLGLFNLIQLIFWRVLW
jgi:hypothetical protein